jgi:FdhE protein
MTSPDSALAGLKRQRPEWGPWLAVVEEVFRDNRRAAWDGPVHAMRCQQNDSPLLHGASVMAPDALVSDLFARLVQLASRAGTTRMARLQAVLSPDVDAAALFGASVQQDHSYIVGIAAALNIDDEALHAVAALLAIPFLQACHRRWGAALDESWVEGYCPLCGAWPAFAEVRGIERTRCFRCGRCGAGWHARPLHCPFCGTDNHDELVSLVPDKPGMNAVIDACRRCRGYVKTFAKLQGCPPDAVMLEDLASVELDIAALDQGYARPSTAGCRISLSVNGKTAQPQEA